MADAKIAMLIVFAMFMLTIMTSSSALAYADLMENRDFSFLVLSFWIITSSWHLQILMVHGVVEVVDQ